MRTIYPILLVLVLMINFVAIYQEGYQHVEPEYVEEISLLAPLKSPTGAQTVAIGEVTFSIIVEANGTTGFFNISPPEGVFQPFNATFTGSQQSVLSVKLAGLNISTDQLLQCAIRRPDGSVLNLNVTNISLQQTNFTLNHTLVNSDPILEDDTVHFLPWIFKNCSIVNTTSGTTDFEQNVTARIYVHAGRFWEDQEITRAVACAGTPGTFFNNTAKCEFLEDTIFTLRMRNGNPVNEQCLNNPGVACADPLCNGIFFPTCDPLDFFGGFSAQTDDPNGFAAFTATAGAFTTPIRYTFLTNSSDGSFKLRLRETLADKTFSITIFNLTNVSNASVYGAETGAGNTTVTDQGDGSFSVAHNRLGSGFTGTLDLTFNVTFNAGIDENKTLTLVLAYGVDNNQGAPPLFNATFSTFFGLGNNLENDNSSATNDFTGPCGDGANNDFDYIGGTFDNSFDCFDVDCNLTLGPPNQTNEFGVNKTPGLCNVGAEVNCSDQFDNDFDFLTGDDFTDCHDGDCFQNGIECPAIELICNNTLNDDWDNTLGETDNAADQKVLNNGTKFNNTFNANITDCEDADCNGQVGNSNGSLCNHQTEINCTDGFDNDALQLFDCNLTAVAGTTSFVTPANGEYDCDNFCRGSVLANETGALCDDNVDNDFDAVTLTGIFSDTFAQNSTEGAGIDCRWNGFAGVGTNFNPDEDCNATILSSGFRCELSREFTCNDTFDNDFDADAAGMPSAGWGANTSEYFNVYGNNFSTDADFDDYDCANEAGALQNESINASFCFDGIDNDLDAFFFNGSAYVANSTGGEDCADIDCLGVTNPANPNQTCVRSEFNASDPFFNISLPFPGLLCGNTIDDDVDGPADCDDPDCFQQFEQCTKGPCYQVENITWDACANNEDEDADNQTNCADANCVGFLGNTSGPICEAIETNCTDSFDNDADGAIDCADANCAGLQGGSINGVAVLCRAAETTAADCFDGFDNDDDGSIDCADTGCNAVCNLSNIAGANPTSLPERSGIIALNSVNQNTQARIQDSTENVRLGENYSITLIGVAASTGAEWTLGTALGGTFNNASFNFSARSLSGPNASTFTITNTVNGFIIESSANHGTGYNITFSIVSISLLNESGYELTYAENSGALTSLNNNITFEVSENVVPVAHDIVVSPNGTDIDFGSTVTIRGNITDNTALGVCDFDIGGVANFDPANSTTCTAAINPTVEGVYTVNLTPVDSFSNIGNVLTENFTLNIRPIANQSVTNGTFFVTGTSVQFNASFTLVGTDALGACTFFARNSSTTVNLGAHAATGNVCNATLSTAGLADNFYTLFATVTETTEGNTITSATQAFFACSQNTTGICGFADFDSDGFADTCNVSAAVAPAPAPGDDDDDDGRAGGGGRGQPPAIRVAPPAPAPVGPQPEEQPAPQEERPIIPTPYEIVEKIKEVLPDLALPKATEPQPRRFIFLIMLSLLILILLALYVIWKQYKKDVEKRRRELEQQRKALFRIKPPGGI